MCTTVDTYVLQKICMCWKGMVLNIIAKWRLKKTEIQTFVKASCQHPVFLFLFPLLVFWLTSYYRRRGNIALFVVLWVCIEYPLVYRTLRVYEVPASSLSVQIDLQSIYRTPVFSEACDNPTSFVKFLRDIGWCVKM